jgi:hypothetical protein
MMLISVMGIISFEIVLPLTQSLEKRFIFFHRYDRFEFTPCAGYQRVVDRGVVFSHLGRGKYQ